MTEKKKYIRRAVHDKQNPYLLIRRATAQDKQLSYEARGLLIYILSQREDWRVQPSELVIEGCGRDKVYRILKELIQAHYIQHEKSFDAQHKIVWGDYLVNEYPVSENPDTENQDMDLRGKPFPENPDTENTDSNKYSEDKKNKVSTRRREKVSKSTSDISKWGVHQLNSYFEEHTALLTSILLLTGIDPSFVNWSEMMQSQRRSYCRACETYLASGVAYDAYEVWLKKRYSWRKTIFVTLKEFVEDIPRYKTDLAHKGAQENAPHDYAAPYHQPYIAPDTSDAIPMPDDARAAMEALRKAWDVTDRKQP